MKYCLDCKANFLPGGSRYRRCNKADEPMTDAGLCSAMRRANAPCGPDATLFEEKTNG